MHTHFVGLSCRGSNAATEASVAEKPTCSKLVTTDSSKSVMLLLYMLLLF